MQAPETLFRLFLRGWGKEEKKKAPILNELHYNRAEKNILMCK